MQRCNVDNCCGCGVCEAVCPQKAIKVLRDSRGFNVACIDESRCNHCGVCGMVCPTYQKPLEEIKVHKFAFHTINTKDAIKS